MEEDGNNDQSGKKNFFGLSRRTLQRKKATITKRGTAEEREELTSALDARNEAKRKDYVASKGGQLEKRGPKPIDVTTTPASKWTFQRRGLSLYRRDVVKVSEAPPRYLQVLAQQADYLAQPGIIQRAADDAVRLDGGGRGVPAAASDASRSSVASEASTESTKTRGLAGRLQRSLSIRGSAAASRIRGAARAAASSIRTIATRSSTRLLGTPAAAQVGSAASAKLKSTRAGATAATAEAASSEAKPWADDLEAMKCKVFKDKDDLYTLLERGRMIAAGADSEIFKCRRVGNTGDSDDDYLALAESKFYPDLTIACNVHGLAIQSITAELRSDVIVVPYECCVDQGTTGTRLLYTMPWFPCGTLQGLIDRRDAAEAITPTSTAIVIKDVADAVGHLKSLGYVWRDCKPANVFVLRSGRAKVADFGFATERAAKNVEPRGTQSYYPPESLNRLSNCYDEYAIGIMLVHMIVLHVPFEQEQKQLYYVAMDKIRRDNPNIDGQQAAQQAYVEVAENTQSLNFCGVLPMSSLREISTAKSNAADDAEKRLASFQPFLPIIRSLLGIYPSERLTVEAMVKHPLFYESKDLRVSLLTNDFRSPENIWVKVVTPRAGSAFGETTETIAPLPCSDSDSETDDAIDTLVARIAATAAGLDVASLRTQLQSAMEFAAEMTRIRKVRSERREALQGAIEAKIQDFLVTPGLVTPDRAKELIRLSAYEYEDEEADILECTRECSRWLAEHRSKLSAAAADEAGPSSSVKVEVSRTGFRRFLATPAEAKTQKGGATAGGLAPVAEGEESEEESDDTKSQQRLVLDPAIPRIRYRRRDDEDPDSDPGQVKARSQGAGPSSTTRSQRGSQTSKSPAPKATGVPANRLSAPIPVLVLRPTMLPTPGLDSPAKRAAAYASFSAKFCGNRPPPSVIAHIERRESATHPVLVLRGAPRQSSAAVQASDSNAIIASASEFDVVPSPQNVGAGNFLPPNAIAPDEPVTDTTPSDHTSVVLPVDNQQEDQLPTVQAELPWHSFYQNAMAANDRGAEAEIRNEPAVAVDLYLSVIADLLTCSECGHGKDFRDSIVAFSDRVCCLLEKMEFEKADQTTVIGCEDRTKILEFLAATLRQFSNARPEKPVKASFRETLSLPRSERQRRAQQYAGELEAYERAFAQYCRDQSPLYRVLQCRETTVRECRIEASQDAARLEGNRNEAMLAEEPQKKRRDPMPAFTEWTDRPAHHKPQLAKLMDANLPQSTYRRAPKPDSVYSGSFAEAPRYQTSSRNDSKVDASVVVRMERVIHKSVPPPPGCESRSIQCNLPGPQSVSLGPSPSRYASQVSLASTVNVGQQHEAVAQIHAAPDLFRRSESFMSGADSGFGSKYSSMSSLSGRK